MLRYPSSLLFLAASLSLPAANAQTSAESATIPAPAASDSAPILASNPPPAPPSLAVSSGRENLRGIHAAELANAVASGVSHYEPPKPAAVLAAEQAAALRDTDVPRNHVVRLPNYVVRDGDAAGGRKLKIPLTPQQKLDLAMKRYVVDTKDMSPFAAGVANALFGAYAMQEYLDAERAREMADLSFDAKEAALSGDAAGSDSIKAEAADLFMRHQDWAAPIPTNRPNASTPR
jgi:hypothetical protein